MSKLYLGVDVGGTKTMVALVSAGGDVVSKERIETKPRVGHVRVLARVVGAVDEVCRKGGVSLAGVTGCGIGVPGPLDLPKGEVVLAPNLNWHRLPLARLLFESTGRRWVIENDAMAAAWGERVLGAGRDFDDFIYLTVSTGIGGGFVLNGNLYHGAWGAGAEVGHMVIDPAGPRCSCGNFGCLEAMASGEALAKRANEALARGEVGPILSTYSAGELKGEQITEAARKGDGLAQALVEELTQNLALGVRNLIHILNPEAVILGGGVMVAGDLILADLRQQVNEGLLAGFNNRLHIIPAALGQMAGAVGAAMVAKAYKG